MADDSLFITRRLKRIAEATEEELDASGDTIVLNDTDLIDTTELRCSGELTSALDSDQQDDEDAN